MKVNALTLRKVGGEKSRWPLGLGVQSEWDVAYTLWPFKIRYLHPSNSDIKSQTQHAT